MDDKEIANQLQELRDDVDHLVAAVEKAHIANVGMTVSTQVVVGAMLSYLIRYAPDPQAALDDIRDIAANSLRDSTHFPDNNAESKAAFRSAAAHHMSDWLGGITIGP